MKPYILLLLFMAFRLAGIGQSFNPSITCPNDTTVLLGSAFALTGGLPAGGSYSGTGVMPGGESFNTNISGLGNFTITYSAGGEMCNFTISVVNQLTISCPNDTVVCNGSNYELTGGQPSGGEYSGKGILPGSNSFNSGTAGGVGTYTITYTVNNQTCTFTITVIDEPDKPVLISPTISVCIGDVVLYQATQIANAKEYLWTLSNNTITNFSTGLSPNLNIVFSQGFQNGELTVTVNNGCQSNSSDKKDITVNSLPSPSISGKNSVCQNEQTAYVTGTFAAYNWTVIGGSLVDSLENTITVNWSTPGSGSIGLQVTDNNGCKNATSLEVSKGELITPDVPKIWLFGSRLLVCSLNDNGISYKWFYKNPEGGYQVLDNSKQYYYVPDANLLDTFKVQACYGTCCNESELYPKQGQPKSALSPSLLSIYPNPTRDLVTLKLLLPIQESYKYRIMDVYGGLQLEGISNELELQLNLSAFKSGIYFLQVQSPTLGIENYKILKTN